MVTSQVVLCPDCHETRVIPSALRWLLDCWSFCSDKSSMKQIIEPCMALNSPWVLLASQGMLTKRVHCGTAWTLLVSQSAQPSEDRQQRGWNCRRGWVCKRWSGWCEASRHCEVLRLIIIIIIIIIISINLLTSMSILVFQLMSCYLYSFGLGPVLQREYWPSSPMLRNGKMFLNPKFRTKFWGNAWTLL